MANSTFEQVGSAAMNLMHQLWIFQSGGYWLTITKLKYLLLCACTNSSTMLPYSTLATSSDEVGGEIMHSSFFGSVTWLLYLIGPWRILTTLLACSGLIVVQRACLLNLVTLLHHAISSHIIHLLVIMSCLGHSAGDYGAQPLAMWWQVLLGKDWWCLVLFTLFLHASSLWIVLKSNIRVTFLLLSFFFLYNQSCITIKKLQILLFYYITIIFSQVVFKKSKHPNVLYHQSVVKQLHTADDDHSAHRIMYPNGAHH